MALVRTLYGLMEITSARALTILAFIFGMALALLIYPELASNGLSGKETAGEITMVFIPYLALKVMTLLLASAFDALAASDRQNARRYALDFEKAKARILRILLDKNIRYFAPTNSVLGIERLLLPAVIKTVESTAPKKGVPIVLVTKNPFLVIRAHMVKSTTVTPENPTPEMEVQVYSDSQAGEVIAKIIISSLTAMTKE